MSSGKLAHGILQPLVLASLLLAACAPAAPPSPTAAPPKPAPTTAPPPQPAATTAPAAKPAPAQPTAQPAAQPAAKPAATAAPKPAALAFDEKSVADFYRGKTIRLIVGYAPGGGFDVWSRLIAKNLGKHVPGNPNVIVENKAGAGSMVAANQVYKSEPKDGTVMVNFNEQMVLQQALGAQGVEFDGRRFNWLGSMHIGTMSCMIHKDVGITDIKQVMGPNGREVTMGGETPGSTISDTPAVANAALGTRFRIIYGYQGSAPIQNAVERREVDGMCISWQSVPAQFQKWFEPEPMVTLPLIFGDKVPDHPWLKKTVAADAIAPNEDARKLLQSAMAPGDMSKPYAVAPEVPADRVAALRAGFEKMYVDPTFVADVKQVGFEFAPKSGTEVQRIVNDLLSLKPEMLETIKKALQPKT